MIIWQVHQTMQIVIRCTPKLCQTSKITSLMQRIMQMWLCKIQKWSVMLLINHKCIMLVWLQNKVHYTSCILLPRLQVVRCEMRRITHFATIFTACKMLMRSSTLTMTIIPNQLIHYMTSCQCATIFRPSV